MFGADTKGIHSGPNTTEASGYNYVTIQRASDCVIDVTHAGDCIAAGRHIVLAGYAKKNHVRFQLAGNTERCFVAVLANAENNEIHIDAVMRSALELLVTRFQIPDGVHPISPDKSARLI
ncbi:hypothetical protein HGO39_21905 [Agrobacterium rosae]|nr:hypothetical protein [Agrobacterium rosae]